MGRVNFFDEFLALVLILRVRFILFSFIFVETFCNITICG